MIESVAQAQAQGQAQAQSVLPPPTPAATQGNGSGPIPMSGGQLNQNQPVSSSVQTPSSALQPPQVHTHEQRCLDVLVLSVSRMWMCI